MPNVYKRPKLPSDVVPVDLAPEGQSGQELTPQTRVLIINRGAHPYADKFDGRSYVVPAQQVAEVPYEVAAHFRERSIIAGSRDPVTGKQAHYIAILGIDPPELCEVLPEEEQDKADHAAEALDRSLMTGPDAEVRVVSTSAARARMVGRGSKRPMQSAETNDGTASANEAMTPPVAGEARRTIARDAAEREHDR